MIKKERQRVSNERGPLCIKYLQAFYLKSIANLDLVLQQL